MMKPRTKFFIFISFVLFQTSTFSHSFDCAGCATEMTQLLNNTELVDIAASDSDIAASVASTLKEAIQQTTQQITFVKQQLQDITGFTPEQIVGAWNSIKPILQSLQNGIDEGQAISYLLSNVDSAFKSRYPAYGTNSTMDYSKAYSSWSDGTKDSINAALQNANLQNGLFDDEAAMMQTLQGLSDNALGTVQVIQAGNAIAGQQVQQLQKLRQLSMQQFSAQANFMATQQSIRDKEVEAMGKFMGGNVELGKVRGWDGTPGAYADKY